MKIQKITIENFRSYYGTNIINVGDGLTLIIGSNGDGKTTLYDALDWLFNSTVNIDLSRLISQKKISEMYEGDSATLRVSIEFEHNDEVKLLEKSFSFTTSYNGSISCAQPQCVLFEVHGSERKPVYNGAERFNKYIFDQNIRRYCMFKGESELNVFNHSQALENLIETFSDIRKFDPYVEFCEEASDKAQQATERALSSNKKLEAQAKGLLSQITLLQAKIGGLNGELKIKQKDAADSTAYLDNLEKNKESSEQLKAINGKLSTLVAERDRLYRLVKENYTIRLLDELWILMGFEPIAREFSQKVASYDKAKRKMENDFQKELGAKQLHQQLVNGTIPLAPYIPDEKTMREMLNDHICKVCNTPAPEGSPQYEFMQKRLQDYLASIHQSEEEEETLFPLNYINELAKKDILLNNEMEDIAACRQRVIEAIELNESLKSSIATIEGKIAKYEEDKKQLLAQVPGLTEDQLINTYTTITNWWNIKNDSEVQIERLKKDIADKSEELEKLQTQYDELAEKSPAAIYSLTGQALRKIWKAFEDAKNRNRQEFLDRLESEANKYLELLNKKEFHGIIRLIEQADSKVKTVLQDEKGLTVHNPNTALSTTMYMSILFAVAKLTTLQRGNDYPLIFDAPTSSFTEAKEADFFSIIGDINKQVIIVTKSFLQPDGNGGLKTDLAKIADINGSVYRLALKEPYDQDVLSTIQTEISKIK